MNLKKIIEFISFKIVSPFNWGRIKFLFTGREFNLLPRDREYARKLMQKSNYIWLSRRRTHLTSYLISFSDWMLQVKHWVKIGFKGSIPRWGYWTHAFINKDDNEFIEAISEGVKESFFDTVLNCDAIVCLEPSAISSVEWVEISKKVVERAKLQEGKKYDAVFNIKDSSEESCIEMVRESLKAIPNYESKFMDFERSIKIYNNLTPQMLYDSSSFKIIWEIRR